MTFGVAGGSPAEATAATFTLTPVTIGGFYLVSVISETSADTPTALSSSNVTWSTLVAATTLSNTNITGSFAVFIGVVTAASAATVTITVSAGSPTLRSGVSPEFSTTAGFTNVALDTSATVNSVEPFPSLTPGRGAGELYFSYCFDFSSTATNGTTSGYSYFVSANDNMMTYNPACTSAVQHPNIGTVTDLLTGIGVLLYEKTTARRPVIPGQAVKRAAHY